MKIATCAASLLHRPALPMHAEWHVWSVHSKSCNMRRIYAAQACPAHACRMACGTSGLYTPKVAPCAAFLLHRPAPTMHAEWHMAHLVCTLQKLQHAPHLCCTGLPC